MQGQFRSAEVRSAFLFGQQIGPGFADGIPLSEREGWVREISLLQHVDRVALTFSPKECRFPESNQPKGREMGIAELTILIVAAVAILSGWVWMLSVTEGDRLEVAIDTMLGEPRAQSPTDDLSPVSPIVAGPALQEPILRSVPDPEYGLLPYPVSAQLHVHVAASAG
jgi:hypothetical protein